MREKDGIVVVLFFNPLPLLGTVSAPLRDARPAERRAPQARLSRALQGGGNRRPREEAAARRLRRQGEREREKRNEQRKEETRHGAIRKGESG